MNKKQALSIICNGTQPGAPGDACGTELFIPFQVDLSPLLIALYSDKIFTRSVGRRVFESMASSRLPFKETEESLLDIVAAITAIATAVSAGALVVVKDTAAQGVREVYTRLKTLIHERFPRIDLALVEQKPDSQARQDVLREDLERERVFEDKDVLTAAQELLALIAKLPDAERTIGLLWENVQVGIAELGEIHAEGRAIGAEFVGGRFDKVIVSKVYASEKASSPKKV